MMRLFFDIGRPGNRIEKIPRCHYDFVTIFNNTRFDFMLYKGNTFAATEVIGNCPAYTILTFPHDKLVDIVNFVWSGGGGVITEATERAQIFFTEENLGLSSHFRIPEIAPSSKFDSVRIAEQPIIFRETSWPIWTLTVDSAVNASVSLTIPAELGRIHVVTGFEAIISAASAEVDIPIAITTTPAVLLWKSFIGSGAPRGTRTGLTGVRFESTVGGNIVMSAIAGGIGCIITLNIHGFTRLV